MTFSDYPYQQPNMAALENEFLKQLKIFEQAANFSVQDEAMTAIYQIRREFETMKNLCSVRHTINTADKFYDAENAFFDSVSPTYAKWVNLFYQQLVTSRFRRQLEEKWGQQLFRVADLKLKTFSPKVMDDLVIENQLKSEYIKLIASARIMFEGKERNLAGMSPFEQSPNRETRREAATAKFQFFADQQVALDRIYEELVQVRTKIAKKLGFENFIPLGYARLQRSDYNPQMAAFFRQQILEHIVPITQKLRQRQARRIGIEPMAYYDLDYFYPSGNPTPKGEPAWIVEQAKKMYHELSPQTDEFFTFMLENELMDLENKPGKASGGYCTTFPNYKSPFIFSNFNGTSHDVDVLTHEAGHAFQSFNSRHFDVLEYEWPTLEACEIHSMSMEFFAWPWLENFFKEDTNKYQFNHLERSLLFLPYGVAVDEFQHFVYENPKATPAHRHHAWREIEKKYQPYKNYDGNEYLENGGFWQRQGHIYKMPFYYIDYTLAQICAFQFWVRMNADRESAWADYVRLCQAGGSDSFLNLVNIARLQSPFADSSVADAAQKIEQWLDQIDDAQL